MDKRHFTLGATALAIACAASAPVLAQVETETTTTTTTVKKGHHQYIYYGDHDIYFAPETRTYYWLEDGSWRSGVELPLESRSYIRTGGVRIELDTERPYERNEWVVRHYKHPHQYDEGDDD
jgi:hypothetical protein